MANMLMDKFHKDIVIVNNILKEIEQLGPSTNLEVIEKRSVAEDRLYDLLLTLGSFAHEQGFYTEVADTFAQFAARIQSFPFVPRIEYVMHAQNILQLQPTIIVIDPPFGGKHTNVISCITVVSSTNDILYHQSFVAPSSSTVPASSAEDLLSSSSPENAIPISQVWSDFTTIVSGRFVLTFDIQIAQTQLWLTAKRFRQRVPFLIGESFFDLCLKYLGVKQNSFLKPTKNTVEEIASFLDQRLGVPYTSEKDQLSMMNGFANNMVQIVREMAEGTLSIPNA